MVPFADMANHTSDHNMSNLYSQDGMKYLAIKDISKGDQIFFTYD